MRRAWMSISMGRLGAFLVLASANMALAQSEPLALFTITPPDPEVGQSVQFDSSFSRVPGGTGTEVLLYTWDFGDGADPVATNDGAVSHPYLNPGLFTIRLEVRDLAAPGVVGVTKRTIVVVAAASDAGGEVVNLLPTAEFTISTQQSAVGDAVSFDASDSSDEDGIKKCAESSAVCDSDADCDDDESCIFTLQYAWDFGDGMTPYTSDATISHAFGAEGNFDVRLFVCDQTTCDADTVVSESVQSIEVLATGTNIAPTAIVASGPRVAAVGETLSFDGQLSFDPNGDDLDFAWDVRFNGLLIDTVLTSVMTRSFDLVGAYTITLEVFDGRGGSDAADPFTVTITEAPPVVEPPAGNPNPGTILEEPADSALQRPTLTMCGMGMIPAMFASILGMLAMAVTRRGSGR